MKPQATRTGRRAVRARRARRTGAGRDVAFAATRPRRGAPARACRAIASEALFGGAGEVHISHRGSLYRLKQTALGKLILTK